MFWFFLPYRTSTFFVKRIILAMTFVLRSSQVCFWQAEAATRDVLSEKEYLNILQISQKISVSQSLLNEVAGLRPETLLKSDSAQVLSCKICKTFKNTYFEEHLSMTALDIKVTNEITLDKICVYKTNYDQFVLFLSHVFATNQVD